MIPVVVHIFEQNQGTSHTNVPAAIAALNRAFDGTVGVDTGIQFCLAQRAPDGSITSGVNRIKSGYNTFDQDLEDAKLIGRTYKGDKFTDESWLGAGGLFSYDHTGPLSTTSGYATLTYNMPLSAKTRLSFGANVGFQNFSFDPDGFLGNIPDPDDPLLQGSLSSTSVDFAAGFWLYSKSFFVGFSTYQFLEQSLRGSQNGTEALNRKLLRHFFGMAGVKVDINRDLFAVPSVLLKQLPSFPFSYDVNLKMVWKKDYWASLSYRNEDSFAVAIGLVINQRLEFGYSYDLITLAIRNEAFGSTEISIGYRLFMKAKVYCPDEFW